MNLHITLFLFSFGLDHCIVLPLSIGESTSKLESGQCLHLYPPDGLFKKPGSTRGFINLWGGHWNFGFFSCPIIHSVRATHSLQLSVPLRNLKDSFLLLLSRPGRLSYSTKDELSAWAMVCCDECLETENIPSMSKGIL